MKLVLTRASDGFLMSHLLNQEEEPSSYCDPNEGDEVLLVCDVECMHDEDIDAILRRKGTDKELVARLMEETADVFDRTRPLSCILGSILHEAVTAAFTAGFQKGAGCGQKA